MRNRSRHSRRTVPTHELFGERVHPRARIEVLTIRVPSERNTSSKPTVNFVSRSADQELGRSSTLGQYEGQVRACWVTHSPAGLAVMPREVDPPGVDLDEELR